MKINNELNKIHQKAKFLTEKKLDRKLIKIFLNEIEGTEEEIKKLDALLKKIQDEIYSQIIFTCTGLIIENVAEAKSIFEQILTHKKTLTSLLNREVGFEVSCLDYLQNIKGEFKNPTIIEEHKLEQFSNSMVYDDKTTAFDNSVLFSDVDIAVKASMQTGIKFALLILDIINFDDILKFHDDYIENKVLQFIVDTFQASDLNGIPIYRYKGDKFAIILNNSEIENTLEKSLYIQKLFDKSFCKEINSTVIVNIGITIFGMHGITDSSGLFNACETALNNAQRSLGSSVFLYQKNTCLRISKKNYKKKIKSFSSSTNDSCFEIQGNSIVSGIAQGTSYIYEEVLKNINVYTIDEKEIENELNRFYNAIENVKNNLNEMSSIVEKELNKEHAAIFDFHKLILEDKKFIKEIEDELRERLLNIESIINYAFSRREKRFKALSDDVFKQKADDISDLKQKIIFALKGIEKSRLAHVPKNSIIFAKKLVPSDTIHLKRTNVNAIVTLQGSANSHSAILARALSIPFISCINKNLHDIPHNCKTIVDSEKGKIIINPSDEIINEYSMKKKKKDLSVDSIKTINENELIYKGNTIEVGANISSYESAVIAKDSGCDFVGLFRIEDFYLSSSIMPTYEMIVSNIREILSPLKDKKITLRLLDIGADKTLPYISLKDEINPALGLRGVRLLLKYRNLLFTLLKACLTLSSEFNINIMIPMVSVPQEIELIRKELEKVKEHMKENNIDYNDNIELGSMIEVPSAFFMLEDILDVSDFISVGTNDLIQYTMAFDRERSNDSHYYEIGNNIILKPLQKIIRECSKRSKSCSICGEMAANFQYTAQLLESGLTKFSVSSSMVVNVKHKIYEILKNK